MFKIQSARILVFTFFILGPVSTEKLQARRSSSGLSKGYAKKAPYAGYGKTSKATGKVKAKGVHGYFKPSNGYKFVNPYARSS